MKKYSQLILTLISGFAVYIFDKIWGDKIPWDKLADIPVIEWLTLKLYVYQFILFAFFFLLLYLLLRRINLKRNDDSIYSKDEQKMKEFNKHQFNRVLWKWEIYFDHYGNPKFTEARAYCTSHGNTPMAMQPNGMTNNLCCAVPGCRAEIPSSEMYNISIRKYHQYIQSYIDDRWEKIKND